MKTGHKSTRMAATTLLAFAALGATTTPSEMSGQWSTKDGKLTIELHWSFSAAALMGVDHLRLDANEKDIAVMSTVVKNLPVTATSFTFQVPTPNRSYRFGVYTQNANNVNAGGVRQVVVLAPGRTLQPTHLTIERDEVNRRVTISWPNYPNRDQLKGFRLFVNNTLAADESVLKNDAKEWKSDQLPANVNHMFELEAVGLNGEISERGEKALAYFRKQQ
jgi:hypothetical protein